MTVVCPRPPDSLPRAWKRLDRDLSRAWRQAQTARQHRLLSELRIRTGGHVMGAVVTDGATCATRGLMVELADGFVVRLGSCHQQAVLAVSSALESAGSVRLGRVQRLGPIWYLEFSAPAGVIPVFAGSAQSGSGRGGLLVAA